MHDEPPPRSLFNRLVVAAWLVSAVYAPGVLLIWGTTRSEGWLEYIEEVGRISLIFLVLPIYFVYMTISVRRFHPRGFLRQFLPFVPLVLLAAAYLRPRLDPIMALESWMMFSLPLFVGFFLALVGGLLVLVYRRAEIVGPSGCLLAAGLAALGALPILYVGALGLQIDVLNAGGHPAVAIAKYLGGIGLVVIFQAPTVRALYREGRL